MIKCLDIVCRGVVNAEMMCRPCDIWFGGFNWIINMFMHANDTGYTVYQTYYCMLKPMSSNSNDTSSHKNRWRVRIRVQNSLKFMLKISSP